jgi:hypothetical protein
MPKRQSTKSGTVRRRNSPRRSTSSPSLVSVYRVPKVAPRLLYQLLQEREPRINISHRAMPSWKQHLKFVASRPYLVWYLIKSGDDYVGAIYLTALKEIGVSILQRFHTLEVAPPAINVLMQMHGGSRYLANVNPRNQELVRMFRRLGFRLIQHTYEWKI